MCCRLLVLRLDYDIYRCNYTRNCMEVFILNQAHRLGICSLKYIIKSEFRPTCSIHLALHHEVVFLPEPRESRRNFVSVWGEKCGGHIALGQLSILINTRKTRWSEHRLL